MTRLIELKTQLHTLKNGISSMDYILKLKLGLCNSLVAIGELVSQNDHLIDPYGWRSKNIMRLLHPSTIDHHTCLATVEEVHSLFLNYEFRLE